MKHVYVVDQPISYCSFYQCDGEFTIDETRDLWFSQGQIPGLMAVAIVKKRFTNLSSIPKVRGSYVEDHRTHTRGLIRTLNSNSGISFNKSSQNGAGRSVNLDEHADNLTALDYIIVMDIRSFPTLHFYTLPIEVLEGPTLVTEDLVNGYPITKMDTETFDLVVQRMNLKKVEVVL